METVSATRATEEEVSLPKINVFGASNISGLVFLNAYTAQDENFNISSGFSAVNVDGVNGKGMVGKENPIDKHNLGGELEEVGQTILITNSIASVKKVSFPDVENPSVTHIVYYDHKRDKPLGYFLEESILMPDGSKGLKTTSMGVGEYDPVNPNAVKPIIIKQSTITMSQFVGAVNTIILAIKTGNLAMKEGFDAEILKYGVADSLLTLRGKTALVTVFDSYFEPTDENIKVLKSVIPELPDNCTPPNIADFKAGISQKINGVELGGIKIKNYKDALQLKNLIEGKFDESIEKEESYRLHKEVRDYLRGIKYLSGELDGNKTPFFGLSVQIVEDIVIGVDTTGSIFVLENSNINKKSGGEITKLEIKKLVGPFRDELDKLKIAHEPREGARYVPDGNAIIIAEQKIKTEAIRLANELGDSEAMAKILAGMHSIAGALINKDENPTIAGQAMAQAKSLVGYINGAHTKLVINRIKLVQDDMLITDGTRIRHQYHSSNKRFNPFSRWSDIVMSNIDVVSVVATLPTLVYPPIGKDEDSIANFRDSKSAVFDIFILKDSGKVVGVEPKNDIGFWNKSQSRLGKILTAILNLERGEEGFDTKLKNFVNYGGIIGDKVTNFGLLALKAENNLMSTAFGSLFQEMRNLIYPNDVFDASKLELLQDKIRGFSGSEDRNLRQLGLYIESTRRNVSRNKLLAQGFYVIASNDNSKRLVGVLNDDFSALNSLEAYPIKAIKDTALVIKSALNGVASIKGNTNLLEVASKIGWSISNSQRLGLIQTGKDKKHWIHTSFKPKTVEILLASKHDNVTKKTSFNSSVLEYIGSGNSLDISGGLLENSLEYQANKPKYNELKEMSKEIESEYNDYSGLDVLSLDMSGLASLGVAIPEILESTAQQTEESFVGLSPEEQEEIEIGAEETSLFADILELELDQLEIALQQHNEEERAGEGIASVAKQKSKNSGKSVVARTLDLI